jgi:hypothetical protein
MTTDNSYSKPAANSTFAIGGVSCSVESSVLPINIVMKSTPIANLLNIRLYIIRHHIYIILLLIFCSCERNASNNFANVQRSDSLRMDSVIPKADISQTIPFLNNSLISYNATSSDKFGDTIYSHDIDLFLKNYPSDGSTFGDMGSYYRATEKLDTLIEVVYKKVYQKLKSNQDKKLFKSSQDNWKRYFESETNFLHEIYYTKETEYGFGREHSITQAQWSFQVARQRLILLRNIDEQTYNNDDIK